MSGKTKEFSKYDLLNSNLVKETAEAIEQATGYKPQFAVDWIGVPGAWKVSWQQFEQELKNFYYYNDYGSVVINSNLIVMLQDGSWLRRWQYDGSEGWEHVILPKEPRVVAKSLLPGAIFDDGMHLSSYMFGSYESAVIEPETPEGQYVLNRTKGEK